MSNKRRYYDYNVDTNKMVDCTEEVFEEAVVDEVVEEPEVVEEVVEEVKEEETLVGVVTGCKKLNVRKNPSKDSDPICVVSADDVLVIDSEKSTNKWYKVYTETGIEGYCMAEYVTVK